LLALPLVSRVHLGSWHVRLGFDSIPLVFAMYCMCSKIIEVSETEIQKLRLANWELARANSQMVAVCSIFSAKEKFSKKDLTV
jgi:hypothetical protein